MRSEKSLRGQDRHERLAQTGGHSDKYGGGRGGALLEARSVPIISSGLTDLLLRIGYLMADHSTSSCSCPPTVTFIARIEPSLCRAPLTTARSPTARAEGSAATAAI